MQLFGEIVLQKKKILNLVFYCLMWNIWLVRNDNFFKKIVAPPTKTANNIISSSYGAVW